MTENYTLTYDAEVKGDSLNITIYCDHPAFPYTHSIPLKSAITAASDDSSLDSIVSIFASKKIRKYNRQQKISDIDLSGTVELTFPANVPPEPTPPEPAPPPETPDEE